jgi:hypothetical protein
MNSGSDARISQLLLQNDTMYWTLPDAVIRTRFVEANNGSLILHILFCCINRAAT